MPTRTNRREQTVKARYVAQGYEAIQKGWPDFCFVRGDEVRFVEVKRAGSQHTEKMGLSAHQRRMIKIFRQLGLHVTIAYES